MALLVSILFGRELLNVESKQLASIKQAWYSQEQLEQWDKADFAGAGMILSLS
jgi:hypothetical protein